MTAIFAAQAILDNRDNLPSLLPDIFDLIDPDGMCVIIDDIMQDNEHLISCYIRFRKEVESHEIYMIMPQELYDSIVLEVDLPSLMSVPARLN